jgi:nucleotide-binding universal stress UspA family protein
VVVAAQPWQAILETARSLSADLVVIGAHSRRGGDAGLGTTASNVVSHADRDVYVVRPRRDH